MTSDYRNPTSAFSRQMSRRAAGFTLIELMITVVIATILLSVAIPMYLHQLRESRRTDARSALMDLAAREERYFATNSAYATTASSLGYQGWGSSYTVGNGGYYYIQSPPPVNNGTTPPSFSFTALPVSGHGQDQDTVCASFTVDSTGKQSSKDGSGNDTSSTCWR
ncbi:MAG TPA: type IV pilin protein [Steroidobacteraceae bacterium]|nr:type IV pilin protein [Steroidobacteraceae bacterium]